MSLAGTVVRKLLALGRRSAGVQQAINEAAVLSPPQPEAFIGRGWYVADQAMTTCRRFLRDDPTWRCGPQRVYTVAREAFDAFAAHGSIVGAHYADLGCGVFHPYGVSALMFANGAESCLATDLDPCEDPSRAAEALADLLADCMMRPDHAHWSELPRPEFEARLRRFDFAALQAGYLDVGLADVPLRYVTGDIAEIDCAPNSITHLSSRAVLEHFLDFDAAMARLLELTTPGGLAAHVVDIGDHRIYTEPERYHRWSFLAEGPDWSDGLVNRLRFSEMRAHIEQAGFEVLSYDGVPSEMPADFAEQLAEPYRSMSPEELAICSLSCVLRKP